ncbi:hypothetical protein CAPTEDRAFT_220731 [Capitella teleta]|uniref:Receptor for retinol uptake STRA6 n=1 Tax=Capitella teleta TaxID=283909 RepID=R7TMP9_CAPTE|nr:hypothetical protein CAPTEDRAFT_220731 [Capitella teleta]|eukprot:ELT92355.1 hypothetical protein CAPTEDRAFT_220731 [Capitella teleta]
MSLNVLVKNLSSLWNGSKWNDTLDPISQPCNSLINADIFIHGSFGFAILLAIIYGFLERRTTKHLDCCNGRPAIVVPINLLDDFHHRWIYACAFGAITNTIVVIFFGAGTYITFPESTWASVFAGLLISGEVCVNFSPFFFCINTRHKIAGNVIGLLYALYWVLIFVAILLECANPIPEINLKGFPFGRYVNRALSLLPHVFLFVLCIYASMVHSTMPVWYTALCQYGTQHYASMVFPYMGLVIELPCLVCLGVLSVRFLVMLIVAITECGPCKRANPDGVNIMASWQRNYVVDLLEDSPARRALKGNKTELTFCEKVRLWVTKYVWQSRPNFNYSTRMMCTIFVVFCCSYQVGVVNIWMNSVSMDWVGGVIRDILDESDANSSLIDDMDFTFHTLKLYKGDTSFLPPAFLNNVKTDSAEIVRSCMMFSGYQIAFMIWGMLIVNYVLWLLAMLFVIIIVLPLHKGITDVVEWLAEVLIIPSTLHFFFKLLQKVMARKLYLQKKLNETEKTQPMALDNLRSFHVFNYFFFIANIQTGIFSCLYRILIGFVFGLVFLGRMDRCVLMERLEGSDKGYMAYLGMLYIEKTHNNPIMRLFCQFLLESEHEKFRKSIDYGSIKLTSNDEIDKRKSDQDDVMQFNDAPYKPLYRVRNQSAFNRWHLAYTLIKNPALAATRAHVIQRSATTEVDAKGAVNQKKYELYMKVKQTLATLETEMYGKVIKKDGRRTISTQTNEVEKETEVTIEENIGTIANTEL